jgi:hypothetical protein
MPTYTVTAEFHVDHSNHEGEGASVLEFVETMMPAHSGVYFVKFVNIEQD